MYSMTTRTHSDTSVTPIANHNNNRMMYATHINMNVLLLWRYILFQFLIRDFIFLVYSFAKTLLDFVLDIKWNHGKNETMQKPQNPKQLRSFAAKSLNRWAIIWMSEILIGCKRAETAKKREWIHFFFLLWAKTFCVGRSIQMSSADK